MYQVLFHNKNVLFCEVICNKYFRQPDKQSDPVELFARKMLRSGRGKEYAEMFIRDCVREFPHRECTIFRQVSVNTVQYK